ncbi:uncharacterized protein [Oscarella lobularis]|uniref:uncharacterized protein isoform X1 n=1 Tax=Oscarella lobularis TaxID=121494 RepID=UPI00331377EC
MADNDLQEVPLDGDETTTTTTTATIGLHDDSLCLSLLIVALGSPAKRNESVTRSSNVANRKESDETRSASASATTSTAADEADDGDATTSETIVADENEEKTRLIGEILELQSTLEDLSQRVQSVKEANMKFKSENQVLSQYIDNLMASSSTFQGTSPREFPKLKT